MKRVLADVAIVAGLGYGAFHAAIWLRNREDQLVERASRHHETWHLQDRKDPASGAVSPP